MSSALRIGFLGAGHIATYHSKSLRHAARDLNVDIVRAGVHDVDRSRAEAFAAASGHIVMDSEVAVIDSCDAVYVCTWTSEHLRLATMAAERGRAVFCEKPLAPDLESAGRLTNVLETSGVVHQVGLVLRHSPAYLWARDLVRDSRAGRVMTVIFRDDQFIPIQGHYASTWRADRERAGSGTLIEHSIHDVDMLHAVIGPIGSVSARQAHFHGIDGIEDVVTAAISFAGSAPSATGSLTSIWHDNLSRPSLRRVEIFCERRYIAIEGDWFGPVTWTDSDGASGSLQGDELVTAASALVPGHANPDGAFVQAVLAGTPAYPSARVALRAHEVVDAMYRSAASGGDAVAVGASAFTIRRATVDEVRPLRLDVLRRGMANQTVTFDGDDDRDTIHLAAFDHDGRCVATSTWLARAAAHRTQQGTAWQLRGMATDRTLQGTGLGGRLLRAGLDAARSAGVRTVWANARDAALDFYRAHGFTEVGDGFIESVTQLPHHVVEIDL